MNPRKTGKPLQWGVSRGYVFPEGGFDLLPKLLGIVKELYPHAKEKGILFGVPVIPDDLPVEGEFLPSAGDSDFQETLFRRGRHGVKDVKPVRVNRVREQGDALMGKVLQLPGEQRGSRVGRRRQIDAEVDRKVQSLSSRLASFS